jgi:5,6-dimethylbenzimidazole synthase
MDVFTAMRDRRSCRTYSPDPLDKATIEKILEAATWAPSPLNMQPWEFIVVTAEGLKGRLFQEADRCRKWALETSGWKWLGKYSMEFLRQAPVVIAVVGDPSGTGVDKFQEEGSVGYQHACAAALQNIHLAAHAMGPGSLWFTFFDKKALRDIRGIPGAKTPLALVCIGKPGGAPQQMPRKPYQDKVTYME